MGISNGDGDGGGDRRRWLWGHFPVPAGCRNRDFLSPKSPLRWRQRCGTFRGFLIDDLGFWYRQASYRRRVKVDGRPGGPHHALARPRVVRTKGVWPPCGPSPTLLLAPWVFRENSNFGFCPVQFREYSFSDFLEPKTAENRQLALRHLVNRLIPENV